ncbi:MAG: hypothetical protein NXH88_01650 [Hyphomonas sp.]|nr:hypothetical protein [Hyphomonas sp.]
MKRLRNTMLAISAILLSVVGAAQAEGVNVHINRSKDVVVHSLGMSPSGRTILNVPDCGPFALETFAGKSGYGVADYRSCGRNYVLEFLHGELISFHVQDVR